MYNVYAPKGSRGILGRKIQKQLETDRENKVWRFTFQMDDWIGYIDLSAWKMNDGKRGLKDEVKANDELAAYDEDELCVYVLLPRLGVTLTDLGELVTG